MELALVGLFSFPEAIPISGPPSLILIVIILSGLLSALLASIEHRYDSLKFYLQLVPVVRRELGYINLVEVVLEFRLDVVIVPTFVLVAITPTIQVLILLIPRQLLLELGFKPSIDIFITHIEIILEVQKF